MLRRLFCFIAATIIVSAQFVDVANAAYDKDFYAGNDILFYDPRCATETGSGTLTLAGNDNLEKILNFYMRKGLTLAQASGIAGNMMVESGLDPTIIQGGGHAKPGEKYIPKSGIGFGLVQWTTGGRQVGLVNETTRLGVDITDLSGQLGYSWKELSENYSSTLIKLKATNDPVQAAIIVHDGYESSADSHAKVVSVRGGNAQLVYKKYVDAPALAGSTAGKEMTAPGGDSTQSTSAGDISLMAESTPIDGSSATPSTTSGGCSAGSDFAGGDLAQTTQQYAWPQYKVRTDQMPAYTEAVSRAKSKGLYIGGNNGNDCGGFVSRLMIDSGFEKRYNSDGKGGNTTSQEAWLKKNWKQISSTDAGDRQPGDVAINDSHTYLYVGQIPGFGSKIASASLGGPQRSPMAGHESATDGSFRWYRKVITVSEAPL
jgi:hypothetical protein